MERQIYKTVRNRKYGKQGFVKATPDAQLKDTIKPAAGAVVGRILGALAKLPCALVVWILLSVALLLQPLRTIF